MPTPFQHLVYASTILESTLLPASIREGLRAHRNAFLFGNTAVDVQSITGQARAETHFYLDGEAVARTSNRASRAAASVVPMMAATSA